MTASPTAVRRLAHARPAISPRARGRLLTAFLAVNLVMVLLSVVATIGWGWLVPGEWLGHLNASLERGTADRYSGVLFGAVAVLAMAQAFRLPAPRSGPRWLWILGWLSAAFFIGLVAFEELHRQVDIGSFVAPLLGLKELSARFRWALVAAPLAVAPAAAAAWVLLSAQRGHPVRALLTVLALALAILGLALDATSGHLLLYRGLVGWFGFPPGPEAFYEVFEEGAEQMAAAALAVVLVEMLAARSDAVRLPTSSRRRLAVALAVSAVLVVLSAFPLASHRVHKGDGWDTGAPWSYAGPIAFVEQPFQANQDYLRRIDVWAFIDGGPAGVPGEIFARLTPEGSDRPIRESRTQVRGARHSNATVSFHFESIPDSSGKRYTLTVGLLSGPRPFVSLGLTRGDVIPEGAAIVNGEPTPFANDLAMRTAWSGRFIDGMYPRDLRIWGLIGEVVVNIFLWALVVVLACTRLSGPWPRFRRQVVWPSVLISALVTADIVIVTLAFLALRSPTQLA